MSFHDEQAAELEAKIDSAWQKCLCGRKYSPAFEAARRIEVVRWILAAKEEGKTGTSPDLNEFERRYLLQTAGLLLLAAVTRTKKLRQIADALDAKQQEAPGQTNVLRAYEDCVEGRYPPTIAETGKCFVRCYVPTFAQLRDAFIRRFGGQCLPTDWGMRKTLAVLGLPLNKSKRGRPVGSSSVIGNPKG
jgi:hypothetical protein